MTLNEKKHMRKHKSKVGVKQTVGRESYTSGNELYRKIETV